VSRRTVVLLVAGVLLVPIVVAIDALAPDGGPPVETIPPPAYAVDPPVETSRS
jgi:hypothetical protein